ncbi:hypothetical protein [Noviherbaspirillum denitrificans]|uniref:hypothetical protein n=1 Tax=Noviherbaspirillum denitrificans TaxID=1968433 RepID=UPI001483AE59|nr:hypothetical protein [Noviherbaspirillum denitrificans]
MNFRSLIASLTLATVALAGCGGSSPSTQEGIAFPGARQDYQIEKSGDAFVVKDKRSGDTYQVRARQTVRFGDASVNLRAGELAASIPAADLRRLILLYTAYFDRVPDADGLVYWMEQFKAGVKIDDIASRMETAGPGGVVSNAEFVRRATLNIFGAGFTPEQSALAVSNLDNGIASRAQVVRVLLNVAESYKGDRVLSDVARLLDNKFATGFQLAVQQGLTFAGADEAIRKALQISAAVTPSDISAAIALANAAQPGFSLYTPAPRRASDPITLDSLRACPNSMTDKSPDFYQCLIGHATGTTVAGNEPCSLTVHEDGRFDVTTASGTRSISPPFGDTTYSKLDHSQEGFFTINAVMRTSPDGELLLGIQFISPALAKVLSLETGIQLFSNSVNCKLGV